MLSLCRFFLSIYRKSLWRCECADCSVGALAHSCHCTHGVSTGQIAADRIDDRVPIQYLRNAFASGLASKLVYREGIHFVETQPYDKLAELALRCASNVNPCMFSCNCDAIRYHREDRKVSTLVQGLRDSSLTEDVKQPVIEMVRKGGVRSRLGVY
jgi:glutamate dehydrogenase